MVAHLTASSPPPGATQRVTRVRLAGSSNPWGVDAPVRLEVPQSDDQPFEDADVQAAYATADGTIGDWSNTKTVHNE